MSNNLSSRGVGGATFAAVLMIIAGTFGVFEGLALVVKGTFYVQPAHYWINTGASTWGWTHILISIVILAAGLGILSGAAWARWTGIVIVGLQALVNFTFIPVQPWWSLTLIAIDVWIVHSLFVFQGEAEYVPPAGGFERPARR